MLSSWSVRTSPPLMEIESASSPTKSRSLMAATSSTGWRTHPTSSSFGSSPPNTAYEATLALVKPSATESMTPRVRRFAASTGLRDNQHPTCSMTSTRSCSTSKTSALATTPTPRRWGWPCRPPQPLTCGSSYWIGRILLVASSKGICVPTSRLRSSASTRRRPCTV